MLRQIKDYTKIFKGIRLPWFLILLVLVISMIKSHVEVEAITITASIIDGTQNSIKDRRADPLYRVPAHHRGHHHRFYLPDRTAPAEDQPGGEAADVNKMMRLPTRLLRLRQCK